MKNINKILVKVFGISEENISDDATMNDIPGWDSLTHMDLITAIEESLGIELNGDEIAEMTSFGNIRKVLTAKNEDS